MSFNNELRKLQHELDYLAMEKQAIINSYYTGAHYLYEIALVEKKIVDKTQEIYNLINSFITETTLTEYQKEMIKFHTEI